MQLTHLSLLFSITLASTLSQKLTPNAVTSLLQGILSPKNTEQVMQMLSAAANKKRALPNAPQATNRRFAIIDNVPRTVIRTETPNMMAQLVQRPQEICTKRNPVIQNSNTVVVQNGNPMVVQKRPEAILPNNVIIQNVEGTLPRNVMVRKNEMPKRVVVQSNDYALRVPQMRTPEVVQQKVLVNPQRTPEIQQRVLTTQPQMSEYVTVPQQKVLIRNDNPFLPAASPLSAITASSSDSMQPGMPKSRGQFLRKIPIPPPSL